VLAARLYAVSEEKRLAEIQAARGEQLGTGGRAERIRTYNSSDDRVSDHRINSTKFGLQSMMEGALIDEFGDELRAARGALRLERLLSELEKEGAEETGKGKGKK